MSSLAGGIRQWRRSPWPTTLDIGETGHETERREPVNTTRRNYPPAEMRASDSDRDAVVSDLSEHFQAGRLTAAEFDQRTGRALAARTWGELKDLLADLPATRPVPQAAAATSAAARPSPSGVRFAPPVITALAGIAITAAVLVNVTYGRLGFIWLLLAALFIARCAGCSPRASRRRGQ
jgi:Domain of unknown function (DUF1707)